MGWYTYIFVWQCDNVIKELYVVIVGIVAAALWARTRMSLWVIEDNAFCRASSTETFHRWSKYTYELDTTMLHPNRQPPRQCTHFHRKTNTNETVIIICIRTRMEWIVLVCLSRESVCTAFSLLAENGIRSRELRLHRQVDHTTEWFLRTRICRLIIRFAVARTTQHPIQCMFTTYAVAWWPLRPDNNSH